MGPVPVDLRVTAVHPASAHRILWLRFAGGFCWGVRIAWAEHWTCDCVTVSSWPSHSNHLGGCIPRPSFWKRKSLPGREKAEPGFCLCHTLKSSVSWSTGRWKPNPFKPPKTHMKPHRTRGATSPPGPAQTLQTLVDSGRFHLSTALINVTTEAGSDPGRMAVHTLETKCLLGNT